MPDKGSQKTQNVIGAGGSMYSQIWQHEDNDTMESLGRYDTQVFEDTLASFGSALFCLLVFVVLSSVVGLVYLELKNGFYFERFLCQIFGLYKSGSFRSLDTKDKRNEDRLPGISNLAIPPHF